MDKYKLNKTTNRITFESITPAIKQPNLLNIQVESFEEFVQRDVPRNKRDSRGLQEVFANNFPIFDNKEFYRLDFVDYHIEKPRFSIQECQERGLTFSSPLKAKLRLSTKDDETEEYVNSIEQEVYLGNLPFMTKKVLLLSMVPKELLLVSCIVHQVLLLGKQGIQMEPQFIQLVLYHSVVHGLNLLQI